MNLSLDVLSDQILAEFQDDLERKVLPQCLESKKSLSEDQKRIDQSKQEWKTFSKALDKIGCNFFGVVDGKDGLNPVEDIMAESRNHLKEVSADLEKLKEKKSEDLAQLAEANVRFDNLKEKLNKIESEMKGLQDSKVSDSYRVLSQMMQTKFQLNKELCCVSLILDDEQRVKGTIKVDKENQPEQELRQNVWSKYYKLY